MSFGVMAASGEAEVDPPVFSSQRPFVKLKRVEWLKGFARAGRPKQPVIKATTRERSRPAQTFYIRRHSMKRDEYFQINCSSFIKLSTFSSL